MPLPTTQCYGSNCILILYHEVPPRTSSPYNALAQIKMADSALALKVYALRYSRYTVAEVLPEARRLLAQAEAQVRELMQRNVFLTQGPQ